MAASDSSSRSRALHIVLWELIATKTIMLDDLHETETSLHTLARTAETARESILKLNAAIFLGQVDAIDVCEHYSYLERVYSVANAIYIEGTVNALQKQKKFLEIIHTVAQCEMLLTES